MYVDDAGGAVAGTGIGKSMADFAGGAKSGAFSVNEEGGAALLKAIAEMKDWLDGERNRLHLLGQEPALGSSNGANVMRPHVQQVATDTQGFLTQLQAFDEALIKADEGIRQAMANYQQTDQVISTRLR
ncbi:hypothetical protein [Actinokineospora sp.]|uniref:hypothetical protein n=1 Tax=Actinokineospora sp. TaxID=1872133 RepID=UPI0040381988